MKALAFELVITDLERFRPDVVVVETGPHKKLIGEGFEFLDFYAESDRFKELWAAYRLTEKVDHWEIYTRLD